MSLFLLADWSTTLSLVFGGCCSHAVSLEQLTSEFPQIGSLITLFHFVAITVYGIPHHITWTRYGPRLKPRRIPLPPYIAQVTLFYLISLLNNAAFAHRVPMSVHIIFRSGGLIVSMALGWLFAGKRYNTTQALSVLIVTSGVILTTLSASRLSSRSHENNSYGMGIAILTVALLLSGFLGLIQDWTYSKHGRPTTSNSEEWGTNGKLSVSASNKAKYDQPPAWQESMFYLHFLALPLFFFARADLRSHFDFVNVGPKTSISTPIAISIAGPFIPILNFLSSTPWFSPENSPIYVRVNAAGMFTITATFPSAYLSLIINTITQILCVAGVNRLIARVSNLSVTLILVVRKAVSLVLSVFFGGGSGVDLTKMWAGAALVLFGTITYTIGTRKGNAFYKSKKE